MLLNSTDARIELAIDTVLETLESGEQIDGYQVDDLDGIARARFAVDVSSYERGAALGKAVTAALSTAGFLGVTRDTPIPLPHGYRVLFAVTLNASVLED